MNRFVMLRPMTHDPRSADQTLVPVTLLVMHSVTKFFWCQKLGSSRTCSIPHQKLGIT